MIKVEVREDSIEISDGPGNSQVLPRAYLYEFIECLINYPEEEQIVYYYQSYGIAFSKRSCRLIRSPKCSPIVVAELKRSSIPYFIKGLYPYIEDTYLGNKERELIDNYLKKSKVI